MKVQKFTPIRIVKPRYYRITELRLDQNRRNSVVMAVQFKAEPVDQIELNKGHIPIVFTFDRDEILTLYNALTPEPKPDR